MMKPLKKPSSPLFSSGPCKKFPGGQEKGYLLGRSHRTPLWIEKIAFLTEMLKKVLDIPADYHVGLTPGSTTGAMGAALWNLCRTPVTTLVTDVFSSHWSHDIIHQLKIPETQRVETPIGSLPSLEGLPLDHDLVFTWNGTTSGVRFPHGDWISPQRSGLTFCDAASAIFCMPLPWDRLDVTVFSFQKGLGSEAGIGALVLSPRAYERLETYTPPWPIPRLLRLKNEGRILTGFFKGETLNTPSLLSLEDIMESLEWAEKEGNFFAGVHRRFTLFQEWLLQNPWIRMLADSPAIASPTALCLQVPGKGWDFYHQWAQHLAEEGVAYDIVNHSLSLPSLRLWNGPTIEDEDFACLLEWLSWSYKTYFQ